jgi:hypothetical protein
MRAVRIGRVVRSVAVLAVLLASALCCAGAAPAMGASGAEIVPAKIVFGAFVRGPTTRIDQLIVYNVTGGGTATVDYGTVHSTRAIPVSGIVNLTSFADRHRFSAGETLSVSVIQTSAAGTITRTATYRFRAGRAPLHGSVCTSPDPVVKGCTSPCPTPAGALRDYCAGADHILAFTLARVEYDHPQKNRRALRIRALRLVGKVPPNAVLGVFCYFAHCPFTVRFFPNPRSRLDFASLFRGHLLPPGAVFELRIFRANAIGQVKRYTVTARGTVKLTKLCLYPTKVGPQLCGS